jgi:hypothetical protein
LLRCCTSPPCHVEVLELGVWGIILGK